VQVRRHIAFPRSHKPSFSQIHNQARVGRGDILTDTKSTIETALDASNQFIMQVKEDLGRRISEVEAKVASMSDTAKEIKSLNKKTDYFLEIFMAFRETMDYRAKQTTRDLEEMKQNLTSTKRKLEELEDFAIRSKAPPFITTRTIQGDPTSSYRFPDI